MGQNAPQISICIPHWQVGQYAAICLRSIRRHSRKYDVEVIVVDNGSHDGSLDYLRSLDWIRLIERPGETRENWPANFFTALDCGLQAARGRYFMTMHTDVFVKRDDWLDPFLREIGRHESIAAAGAWKLDLQHPLYRFQKRLFGYLNYRVKRLLGGRERNIRWKQGDYPRDYCAMYRRAALVDNYIVFRSINGWPGGGYSIARQIWAAGYSMGMFPVNEMGRMVVHVTHGTAAVTPENPLNHRRSQQQAEQRVRKLLAEPWVQALANDKSLDAAEDQQRAAA